MSSARQPEFFFDRSLGKASARRLRDEGWIVHLIAEFYEADATNVADEEWIAEQTRRGWILLTKDKKRRSASSTPDQRCSGPSANILPILACYERGRIAKMWP
jgi:uncharacterized protein with PIN domain